MTEMQWGTLSDIEFDKPETEISTFFITDDRAAGWAMRKIAAINANEKRMLDQIDARLREITAALQHQAEQERKKAENERAYFEQILAVYFDGLPEELLKKTKAGRVSYDLPEGKIMMTAPKREYRHDDAKLLDVLKEHGMQEYIRRKETPDWAAIKKTIMVDASGNVAMVNLMGEIIETDAIVAVDVPGEFRVEVE